MERLKYLVVTKKGHDILESRSLLKCGAYIRRAARKGAPPGSLAIVWDYPKEKRCFTCEERAKCPAFNSGVIRPCPYYRQKEA